MRWKQDKTDPKSRKSPFLVLPKIETLYDGKTSPTAVEMPTKNPGLRLFTKTWRPQKETETTSRPLTATLEKPQILDIDLATKIDMSLIRKEFLCIANLCRVPLNTLTGTTTTTTTTTTRVRRKPGASEQSRRCRPPNRPLSLPGGKVQLKKFSRPCTSEDSWEEDRSSSSQTYSSLSSKKSSKMSKIKPPKTPIPIAVVKPSKLAENDANNNAGGNNIRLSHHHHHHHTTSGNGFKTYRIPNKNRTVRVSIIDKTENAVAATATAAAPVHKLPQPCKTCGRVDQPERFHSHPRTPSVPPTRNANEKVPVVKNTVQKPVAIKYKSKLTEKRKIAATSPVKKSAVMENVTRSPKKASGFVQENRRNATSAKGPRTLTCYICGREFGTMSLPLHEPKCMEKWDRENSSLPRHLQRKRPIKPDHALTKDEWNTFAWESSQANLVPCQNCGRTFYPDRLIVHQRSCKPKEQPQHHPPPPPSATMAKFTKEESTDAPPVASAKPRSVPCGVCGRLFGTKSIKIHEPQCSKKWHLQNDRLPPGEREAMYRDVASETPKTPPETIPPEQQKTPPTAKKPPMFPCYLCGRLFSVNSIYIHEPQCLKKWRAENEKLPPHKRRPEPLKPDIKFTPDGKMDQQATMEANWLSHLDQLVPCRMCGRTFNPERVEVHEKSCKGQGKKGQDIRVEILH